MIRQWAGVPSRCSKLDCFRSNFWKLFFPSLYICK